MTEPQKPNAAPTTLRFFSWNINGLRAVLRKNALQSLLEAEKPDFLCLQEIKCRPDQVDWQPENYDIFWNPAVRPGYSGTAILVKKSPKLNNLFTQTNPITPVDEGRILTLETEQFYLTDVYVPNSKPDLSRLELREKFWDPEFRKYLSDLAKKKPVIVCGDFNAAHTEIDIARPDTNHHHAGFTDEERQGITNYLNSGLIDTFRLLHPKEQKYTWWSHWGHARENNVGWRIDYFFISENLKNSLKSAEIHENYLGSDHCPISIELDFSSNLDATNVVLIANGSEISRENSIILNPQKKFFREGDGAEEPLVKENFRGGPASALSLEKIKDFFKGSWALSPPLKIFFTRRSAGRTLSKNFFSILNRCHTLKDPETLQEALK